MEGYRNKDSIELVCVWSSEKVESLRAAACLSLPIMPSVAEALEVWVSVETERFLWHCSSKPWPGQASQYLQLRRCVLFRRRVQARLKPSTHPVWLWTLAFQNQVCGFVWYFFSFAVFLFLVNLCKIVRNPEAYKCSGFHVKALCALEKRSV